MLSTRRRTTSLLCWSCCVLLPIFESYLLVIALPGCSFAGRSCFAFIYLGLYQSKHVTSTPLLARGRSVIDFSSWHPATTMNVNANIPDTHREVVRCWPKEVKSDQVKELMRDARMLSRGFYALSWRAFEHTLLASCISVAALLIQCSRSLLVYFNWIRVELC